MEQNMKDQEVTNQIPQGGDPNDPQVAKIMQQAKAYETVLKNIIHGEETRDDVIEMLTSVPDPLVSMPQAAMTINDMGVATMKQGGVNVSQEVQMVASGFLLDDLSMLGEATQTFTMGEEEMAAVMEDTFQIYVERGLEDGSIDPIQLQLETEKLMSKEQIAAGVTMGQGKVPQKPNQQAATAQYTQGQVKKAEENIKGQQLKKEAVAKQQALINGGQG